MLVLFVIAADVAVLATVLAITARVVLHALLYLALSLIAVGVVFFSLGAPFMAALEVIIYAGAIIVLFIFAVMLLAPGLVEERSGEPRSARLRSWILPVVLALVLLGELIYLLTAAPSASVGQTHIGPRAVGIALFTRYAVVVELASMLLLVALVGARHLAGHREPAERSQPSRDVATLTELDGVPRRDGTAIGREAGEAGEKSLVGGGGGEAMSP